MVYAVISILTALAVFATVLIIVGVRVQGYFDLQTGTFVVDAFALKRVHVFRYKLFECSGSFYSQINARELKKASFSQTEGKSGDDYGRDNENGIKRTAQKISAFASAIGEMQGVGLKRLRAYLTVGTGDSMTTSVVAATIAGALGVLCVAMRNKLKVKDGDIGVFPNFRHENTVLTFDIDAGHDTAGILLALFTAARKAKRKFKPEKSEA